MPSKSYRSHPVVSKPPKSISFNPLVEALSPDRQTYSQEIKDLYRLTHPANKRSKGKPYFGYSKTAHTYNNEDIAILWQTSNEFSNAKFRMDNERDPDGNWMVSYVKNDNITICNVKDSNECYTVNSSQFPLFNLLITKAGEIFSFVYGKIVPKRGGSKRRTYKKRKSNKTLKSNKKQ
jgi:hypothetical protein